MMIETKDNRHSSADSVKTANVMDDGDDYDSDSSNHSIKSIDHLDTDSSVSSDESIGDVICKYFRDGGADEKTGIFLDSIF